MKLNAIIKQKILDKKNQIKIIKEKNKQFKKILKQESIKNNNEIKYNKIEKVEEVEEVEEVEKTKNNTKNEIKKTIQFQLKQLFMML